MQTLEQLNILVTGGAGFIGSAVTRMIVSETAHCVCVYDKLTYAGNLESLQSVAGSSRFRFEQADICDREELERVFDSFCPDVVMHLAAESHVDRSIDGPGDFIQTNVVGTYAVLEASRRYWSSLSSDAQKRFRLHHISTDEVFGDLGDGGGFFREESAYNPSSPYSATKAAADHLVRAWSRTFHLPMVITNCSNNYGPYHFPEKLIPLTILNALDEKALPIYGDGGQVRDWLYVDDHARALLRVATVGKIGESYNVGAQTLKTNLEVVKSICEHLDQQHPRSNGLSYKDLITHVADRPGHDRRYAIDNAKICRELGWTARENWESGIAKTVQWYLLNRDSWCKNISDGTYRRERLGLPGGLER